MNIELSEVAEKRSEGSKTVSITVNERPVNFSNHKATGLEIKQTAIKQGVAIQADFVLFEVKGNAQLKQIGDCDTVTLHKGQVFRATAPDDNS